MNAWIGAGCVNGDIDIGREGGIWIRIRSAGQHNGDGLFIPDLNREVYVRSLLLTVPTTNLRNTHSYLSTCRKRFRSYTSNNKPRKENAINNGIQTTHLPSPTSSSTPARPTQALNPFCNQHMCGIPFPRSGSRRRVSMQLLL